MNESELQHLCDKLSRLDLMLCPFDDFFEDKGMNDAKKMKEVYGTLASILRDDIYAIKSFVQQKEKELKKEQTKKVRIEPKSPLEGGISSSSEEEETKKETKKEEKKEDDSDEDTPDEDDPVEDVNEEVNELQVNDVVIHHKTRTDWDFGTVIGMKDLKWKVKKWERKTASINGVIGLVPDTTRQKGTKPSTISLRSKIVKWDGVPIRLNTVKKSK